ncbi:hypothetical protein [Pseudomonas sp. BMS12]|uniref:hypothetical protein n=1 Tax=Pseudomonas sp. BMS12 TaxID=1796033 RepID=UPI000839F417|nr:hypothetical protein [Pseudomonas sp. BMS12]
MDTRKLLLAGLLLGSLQAQAGNPLQPIELSDAELAQLRGRYILPNSIISFGVTMSTLWQNSAGQVIGAQINLNINGQSQPNLTITSIEQNIANGSASSGNSGQVIGGAGLDAVNGIVQSVRAAGDLNLGHNDLSINISRGGNPATPQGDAWQAGGYEHGNAVGTVSVQAFNGGLRIALQASDGQGFAQQQIGGGSLMQHANISGSLNQVRNLAAVDVALRNNPGLDLKNFCAFEQLRGLQRGGY